jgi:hypothetical protein
MRLIIEWKAFPADMGIIWRRHADSLYWSEQEDILLHELYPIEPPETIMQALPCRTWKGILSRANELGIYRRKKTGGVTYPHMSAEDLQLVEEFDIPIDLLGVSLFTKWVSPFHA